MVPKPIQLDIFQFDTESGKTVNPENQCTSVSAFPVKPSIRSPTGDELSNSGMELAISLQAKSREIVKKFFENIKNQPPQADQTTNQ